MRGFKPCSLRRPSKSMQASNDSSRLGWRWNPLGSTASGYRGRYVQSFQTFYQGFAERCAMLPASCSRRDRLASSLSRPSFAQRPCLAISVLIFSDLCERPSRFQPGALPTELVGINGQSASSEGRILLRRCDGIVPSLRSSTIIDNETANAIQAESIGTSTEVPPDCGRLASATNIFRRFSSATLFRERDVEFPEVL